MKNVEKIATLQAENALLRSENDELRETLKDKVVIVFATQEWLGLGAITYSVQMSTGTPTVIHREPYRPGGVYDPFKRIRCPVYTEEESK